MISVTTLAWSQITLTTIKTKVTVTQTSTGTKVALLTIANFLGGRSW